MNKISLDVVYKALENTIPELKPLIPRIVKKIKIIQKDDPESEFCNTAGIDYKGILYVNQEFWDTYLSDPSSLSVLLLHELYHDITGDTKLMEQLSKEVFNEVNLDDLELRKMAYNVSMDCRINASIYLTSNIKDPGKLFRDCYTPEIIKQNPILSLVTPYGRDFIPEQELLREYDAIYNRSTDEICTFREMYELVYDYLKRNKPPSLKDILDKLLGTHEEGEGGKEESKDPANKELKKQLVEALGEYLQINNKQNEFSKNERALEKHAGTTARTINEVILGGYTGVDQKFNLSYFKIMSFNSIMNNVRLEMDNYAGFSDKSLFIPPNISRADIVKLTMGNIPMSWDTFSWRPVKTNRKIPIYLDVSGSMYSELPAICQLLVNVKDDIEYVWGFSEEVHKHTMEDLSQGKLKTTGGTDFDCIIQHAIENGFRNLLVITDGFANCEEKIGEKLEEIDTVTVVLCTNQRNSNNYFCNTYQTTVQIEDVTTEHV